MAGMLKLVTVLFADLVGSTEQAARMYPEDVHALLSRYFEAMREEIEAEGGVVEKFVGDAVMAVFGVPRAHEDDPVRAVRAARRMLVRLERLNEKLPAEERLAIRIGINTGDVIAAPSAGLDQMVTGDPVNVASRLEEHGEPGTVVIGERTARVASRFFELLEVGAIAVEGHEEPVRVWEVVRPGPAETGVRAPLIAREPELAFLQAAFQRAKSERTAHLVTIVGDPGVGKSRIVAEFAAGLEADSRLLLGRCAAYGASLTLRPLAEILQAEAVVLDDDPAAAARVKIEQLVRERIGDRDGDITEVFASMLGLERDERALPRAGSQRLVDAWRALLSGIAAAETLVVVIEDLHWADETTLAVLDGLVDSVTGPVLFVCTSRPELTRLRPSWGAGKRNFSSLTLGPLDTSASARLLAALLDSEGLPTGASHVLETAEGNPFFLEEIVRRLVDAGLLEQVAGRWRIVGDLSSVSIPETVEGVILARIDLLSPSERRTLQDAAVVGRVFWEAAVERASGMSRSDDVQTLCRRELVLERPGSGVSGRTEYVFKHGLTRDVAYASLPRRERAEAHRRVAEWLAEIAAEDELIAHHHEAAYELTGDEALRVAARREYLAGSIRALGRFAVAQAAALGRRAVELSRDPGERIEALEQFGDLGSGAHSGDEAWDAYRSALELTGDPKTRARLAAKAAVQATRWFGAMHDPPSTAELEALIDEGLEAAGEQDSLTRAMLLMSRGFEGVMGYATGRPASREAAEEALAMAERLDDPDLVSGALDAVGSQLLLQGAYGEHLRFGRRRVVLVPRLSNPVEVGDAHVMAAWSALYVGHYDEAEAHATACIESSRGFDPGEYIHGLAWRVWARTMVGDWDGALADQAELERLHGQAAEIPLAYTLKAYSAAAFVHELRGDAEASTYFDLLRNLARECVLSAEHDAALALGARAYAHRGELEAAGALLGLQSDIFAPPTHEALCELARMGESWDDAGSIAAAARSQAHASEAIAVAHFADRLTGCAAAARGDSELAVAALHRSAQGFAILQAPWEEATSRLLLGETLGDAAEIDRAQAVFERLGAAPERTLTR